MARGRVTRSEVEDFLYLEARLIDERRFDDWLALFTDDAVYWVPAGHGDTDPDREVSLIYDDHPRLEDRVFRLQLPTAYAQSPPSRTVHIITNVEVETKGPGEVAVRSCFVIYEIRGGDWRQRGLGANSQGAVAGRYEHHLRHLDGTWQIRLKKATLVQSNLPYTNLSFLI